MATFKPHYTLCPLLGAQNLVGVSADKEESMILVTLGPNIIVKQKVWFIIQKIIFVFWPCHLLIAAVRSEAPKKLEH